MRTSLRAHTYRYGDNILSPLHLQLISTALYHSVNIDSAISLGKWTFRELTPKFQDGNSGLGSFTSPIVCNLVLLMRVGAQSAHLPS